MPRTWFLHPVRQGGGSGASSPPRQRGPQAPTHSQQAPSPTWPHVSPHCHPSSQAPQAPEPVQEPWPLPPTSSPASNLSFRLWKPPRPTADLETAPLTRGSAPRPQHSQSAHSCWPTCLALRTPRPRSHQQEAGQLLPQNPTSPLRTGRGQCCVEPQEHFQNSDGSFLRTLLGQRQTCLCRV